MYTITLDNNTLAFEPIAEINGFVRWKDLDSGVERLEVRLIWFTSGKGDRDVGIIDAISVNDPTQKTEANFKFQAPSRPYSFSGKLVSLSWAIEVVDFPGLNAEQKELVIAPNLQEIQLHEPTSPGD